MEYPVRLIEFYVYRMTWPRKTLWYCFYEMIDWLSQTMLSSEININSITSLNLGYAWITESGDLPKSHISMPDDHNKRQYQLYDYCVTNMIGYQKDKGSYE